MTAHLVPSLVAIGAAKTNYVWKLPTLVIQHLAVTTTRAVDLPQRQIVGKEHKTNVQVKN